MITSLGIELFSKMLFSMVADTRHKLLKKFSIVE